MAFTFTSQVTALASPTTVDTFKTALDADLASLETGVGITSAVLALPTNHVPADFYAAFMADIQALANKGVPLSLVNATGRESWSTFMASLKSDMGLLVNYFSTPTLSINNVSLTEGNVGTKYATFTVSLSHAYHQNVTFDYATVDGTATVANNDYTATNGTGAVIPAWATTYTINVPIIGDTVYESDETFTVNLSNPVNATISTGTGTGTILNDDVITYAVKALFDVADTGALASGDLNTQAPGSVSVGAVTIDTTNATVEILSSRLRETKNVISSSGGSNYGTGISFTAGQVIMFDMPAANYLPGANRHYGFDITGASFRYSGSLFSSNDGAQIGGTGLPFQGASLTRTRFALVRGGFTVSGDRDTNGTYGYALYGYNTSSTAWELLFLDPSYSTTSVSMATFNYYSGVYYEYDNVQQVESAILPDIAPLQLLTVPVAGTAITATADGVFQIKVSSLPTTGSSTYLTLREVDSSNMYQVTIDSTGALSVDEVTTGTPASVGSATGIVTGDMLTLRVSGSDLSLWVGSGSGSEKIYYGSATYTGNATAHVGSLANGAAISWVASDDVWDSSLGFILSSF